MKKHWKGNWFYYFHYPFIRRSRLSKRYLDKCDESNRYRQALESLKLTEPRYWGDESKENKRLRAIIGNQRRELHQLHREVARLMANKQKKNPLD